MATSASPARSRWRCSMTGMRGLKASGDRRARARRERAGLRDVACLRAGGIGLLGRITTPSAAVLLALPYRDAR